jgi:hypothetical protein
MRQDAACVDNGGGKKMAHNAQARMTFLLRDKKMRKHFAQQKCGCSERGSETT